MKKLLSTIALVMCLATSAGAQQRIQFHASKDALPVLSSVVSIDRVDEDLVTAYGNKEELIRLDSLGYSFDVVPSEQPKVLNMATTVEQMASWDRYPTYETYLALMERFSQCPFCHIDTIGRSVQNRLILCAVLSVGENVADRSSFFYSSTIHGDEVTGYYLMLRLIDTLINGYGTNDYITRLLNHVDVYINPLANPDGTYISSNSSVAGSQRYNANYVDLNRNYPDPFGTAPLSPQQVENTAMIDYFANHNFYMSANLHGGAEVLNYPWDSFTSSERPHPMASWWKEVCKEFIDSVKHYSSSHFRDVTNSGYIAGGDWYVISNGRQDYVNYYTGCNELTMELSTQKTLSTDRLNDYWNFQHAALLAYISRAIRTESCIGSISSSPKVYPNPTTGLVNIELQGTSNIELRDIYGRLVMTCPPYATTINMSSLPSGVYLLRQGSQFTRIVKR